MMENSFLRDMYLAADVGLLTVQLLSAAPDDSVGEGPGGVEGAGHCVNCFGKIRDLFTFVRPGASFPSLLGAHDPIGPSHSLHFPLKCREIRTSLLIPPSYKNAKQDSKQHSHRDNHVHCAWAEGV